MSDPVLRNWARNVEFSTRTLVRPRSIAELQEVVARTPRLRALGSGHSFNRIADTDGVLVSVADLGIEPSLDEAHRTVCVGAGTRYGELGAFLQPRGWAVHNLGSLPHITVAGACATGTHGSGVGNGCLATAVTGIEFVRPDGELVRLERGDESFDGAVLALGALGIVTRLWLRVEPSYLVRQDVWLDASLDLVLADLDAVLAAGYSVSLFSDWSRRGIVDQLWFKSAIDGDIDGGVVDASRWGAVPARVAQHPLRGVDAGATTDQLGVPGPWNERLPHFRLEFTPSNGDEVQSEYFVDRRDGVAALAAVAGLDLAPALQVSEIRTIASDELWISPFGGRDTLALHFTWVDDADLVAAAVAKVEAALAPFDARPHWGKAFGMPMDRIREHYPRLGDFAALVARHDPHRALANPFLDGILL